MKSNYKRRHRWRVDIIWQEAILSSDDTVPVFSNKSWMKKRQSNSWTCPESYKRFIIWYICQLQFGCHPVAVVQYTFTHKQYTERHKTRFQDNRPVKVVRLPAESTGRLYPQEIFLVLICVQRLSRPQGRRTAGRMTPSGIEPATLQL